jgi:hypothetical protein
MRAMVRRPGRVYSPRQKGSTAFICRRCSGVTMTVADEAWPRFCGAVLIEALGLTSTGPKAVALLRAARLSAG